MRVGATGAAAMADTSLPSLPVRPRLRATLRWRRLGETLVVTGLERPRRFTGSDVATALVPLLERLSRNEGGSFDDAETHLLRLLDSESLLEETPDGLETELTDWLSLRLADSGRFPHGPAARAHLGTMVVRVVGPPIPRLSRLLVEFGVSVRADADCDADLTLVRADAPDDLIGYIVSAKAVLPWGLYGATVSVGPYVEGVSYACGECVRAEYAPIAGSADRASRADQAAVAALLGAEILALLAGIGTARSVRAQWAVDLATWEMHRREVPPRIDCVVCAVDDVGVPLAPTEAARSVASDYREALLPASVVGERQQYGHYSEISVRGQSPHLLNLDHRSPLIPLDMWTAEDLSRSPLAETVRATYGIEAGLSRRGSPTGGNLGSPRILIVEKGRLLGYEPQLDSWHVLGEADGGDAVLVGVADLRTLRQKYGPRAVRIAALDAGVARRRFEIASRTSGLALEAIEPAESGAMRQVEESLDDHCVTHAWRFGLRDPNGHDPDARRREALALSRRSERNFNESPLSTYHLDAILRACLAEEGALTWRLVAQNVLDLRPGAYAIEDGGFVRTSSGIPSGIWSQTTFDRAPAVVVAVGSLVVNEPTDRLLRRAAGSVYGVSLTLLEQGLGSCIFFGPTLGSRAALGLNHASRVPLLALAVGVPS